VLQPRLLRTAAGLTTATELPTSELQLAALALARLHTSQVRPGQMALRSGAKEAQRARERAGLLAGYYRAQAADIQDLVQALTRHLEKLQPPTYRPAHGGFKASQLLYDDETVFVVDFDGFCLADPALDTGYFLAYLRPSGLWYGRQSMRAWFETAGDIFTTTYARALRELGLSSEETTGILQRAQLYAAALLFKIATRRVNRLNSPRTQELAGMLKEIASCLALTRRME
jgi:thiamine kinase-like enzyme